MFCLWTLCPWLFRCRRTASGQRPPPPVPAVETTTPLPRAPPAGKCHAWSPRPPNCRSDPASPMPLVPAVLVVPVAPAMPVACDFGPGDAQKHRPYRYLWVPLLFQHSHADVFGLGAPGSGSGIAEVGGTGGADGAGGAPALWKRDPYWCFWAPLRFRHGHGGVFGTGVADANLTRPGRQIRTPTFWALHGPTVLVTFGQTFSKDALAETTILVILAHISEDAQAIRRFL